MTPQQPNISDNVTYEEATFSSTAEKNNIDNTPGAAELLCMKLVATQVFERLRTGLGNKPIGIDSFYRCDKLNDMIGGAHGSQHVKGQAIDINGQKFGTTTNLKIFQYIINKLDYDQLIAEFPVKGEPEWVHVSYVSPKDNRRQILKGYKDKNGEVQYMDLTNTISELMSKPL